MRGEPGAGVAIGQRPEGVGVNPQGRGKTANLPTGAEAPGTLGRPVSPQGSGFMQGFESIAGREGEADGSGFFGAEAWTGDSGAAQQQERSPRHPLHLQ